MNLTAIRDPEEIITRHFGESLFAARELFPRSVDVRIAAPESLRRAESRSQPIKARHSKAACQDLLKSATQS